MLTALQESVLRIEFEKVRRRTEELLVAQTFQKVGPHFVRWRARHIAKAYARVESLAKEFGFKMEDLQ